MFLQNIFGYIRAMNYVKISVFKTGIFIVYLFTCISRFHIYFIFIYLYFPKKIGDPRFLTDNIFL
jgi:hypothetical protein